MTEFIFYVKIIARIRKKMSIKLCLLKTGQTIIADLKEVMDYAENKQLGYKVVEPYSVDFEYRNTIKLDEEGRSETSTIDNAGVKFNFWAPLSAEREFNFPYEFISVIYEPHKQITELYNTCVNHYISENTEHVIVDGRDAEITYNQDLESTLNLESTTKELPIELATDLIEQSENKL